MNHFDDIQIEESAGFDFAEASFEDLFDEVEDENKTFNAFLNSNWDF